MSSWRDAILNDFIPNVSKLTLVADPDDLLTEEKLVLELQQRGFALIEFTDPIEFRYEYESKFRSIWDRGEQTDLVVILHSHNSELESLPYDLLQAGRKLTFNLGEIFPNLSYPVIDKLDRSLLDALYDAQSKLSPDRMGDNATKDFILRSVFGVAAELINDEVDLLRVLLRLHYSKTQIPKALAIRLVHVLCGHRTFKSWPLNQIVPDEEAFFAFLQERWPVFLSKLSQSNNVLDNPTYISTESSILSSHKAVTRDGEHQYGFKYSGPDLLPFDHQDIKVYIDNLFVEGKLVPVKNLNAAMHADSWVQCGIIEAGSDDNKIRISRLFALIESGLPELKSRHSDWTTFALKWGELSKLVHCSSSEADKTRLQDVGDSLNVIFSQWLNSHYASLINLSPKNQAMLHHIPRYLARKLEDEKGSRVALLVIDGLALDQWVTMRQVLHDQDRDLVIHESATFAWIPTLTSVSRQAIFSGKPPLYYPSSINSTNSEGKLWKQFWEGIGLSRLDIAYQRSLGDGDVAKVLEETVHTGKTRAVGLVIDKVDKIMHGMQLGAAGMHNQIKQWCEKGFLGSLIGYLLDHGYEVWMTSDHGNIECRGKGRPSEGVIAETRGERVRVYPTPELRSQVATDFTFAHEWQPIGLPPNYFPLVTSGSDAFVKTGDSIVGHGGIAIEEVIVPLIKFERRPA